MNEFDVTFFYISFGLYFISMIGRLAFVSFGAAPLRSLGRYAMRLGAVIHLLALGFRMHSSGYAPMSNMYESVSLMSFFIVVFYIALDIYYPVDIIGVFAGCLVVIFMAVASIFPKDVKPLMPALQSYWLALHVSVAFMGYAAFAVGYVASILYLIKLYMSDKARRSAFSLYFSIGNLGIMAAAIVLAVLLKLDSKKLIDIGHSSIWDLTLATLVLATAVFYLLYERIGRICPEIDLLDEIAYKSITFGLPLFTLGAIIFGAIWAENAWGQYWGWDPKETWALITWFVYIVYLHMRYVASLSGEKAAYVAILGFLVTMFTYFGVNFLDFGGLHSYAAL